MASCRQLNQTWGSHSRIHIAELSFTSPIRYKACERWDFVTCSSRAASKSQQSMIKVSPSSHPLIKPNWYVFVLNQNSHASVCFEVKELATFVGSSTCPLANCRLFYLPFGQLSALLPALWPIVGSSTCPLANWIRCLQIPLLVLEQEKQHFRDIALKNALFLWIRGLVLKKFARGCM